MAETEVVDVAHPDAVPAIINRDGSPVQAQSDEQLIRLWLHGRTAHTVRAYRHEIAHLFLRLPKALRAITLADLQAFADSFPDLAPASLARRINAVKSLFGFAQDIGYIQFDPAAPLKPPHIKGVLAERILEEAEVIRMLALERDPRNHALLRMLYLGGLRISEAAGLTWRNMVKRGNAGQVTVFGKGGKTRVILLPAAFWKELTAFRGEAGLDDPVFPSRVKSASGHIEVAHIHRIVKRAALRAGLPNTVSAHWLRHAHASHALDRGAAPHLVQTTLGHADLKTTSKYAHAKPNESSATYLVG